jgi:hypothetical protein
MEVKRLHIWVKKKLLTKPRMYLVKNDYAMYTQKVVCLEKGLYNLGRAYTIWEEIAINSFDFVIVYFNQYVQKI